MKKEEFIESLKLRILSLPIPIRNMQSIITMSEKDLDSFETTIVQAKREIYKTLIKSIVNNEDIYLRIKDGFDREFTDCPLCDTSKESTRIQFTMDSFPHKKNCPYLIAKAIREVINDENDNI